MISTKKDIEAAVREELSAACRIVMGVDGWSKKGLTASFLAVSATFYSPVKQHALHVLLNLHSISHPHTGEEIANKLQSSLDEWEINCKKVLMVVTDNAANMVKAIKSIVVDRKETAVGEETEDEDTGDDNADVGEDDADDESAEEEDGDDGSEEEDLDEPVIEHVSIGLRRLPCVAHTMQLVLKENEKNDRYKNLN